MNNAPTLQKIKAFARNNNFPLIPVNANNLVIIDQPGGFYDYILRLIKKSSRRINLSALYLGIGSKERAIVDSIAERVGSNKALSVNIVLDAKRATRSDLSGISSVGMLKNLIGFDNVTLNLIDTRDNSFFSRFMNNFQRWNEIFSTYHTKFMVMDDNVLLTGANLSEVYFNARRDRYMLVKDSPLLANYISDLLEHMSCSRESLKDRLCLLNRKTHNLVKTSLEFADSDTYLMPLVQFGQIGITDKEDFLIFLQSICTEQARLYLTSGYFNPSPKIDSLKLHSVLAASEESNNFSESSGLTKYVPKLYSALYMTYLDKHRECKLYLYEKNGWSFHAKGIWLEMADDIYINVIGSSNYNHRSSYRDLETQMVIITKNTKLIKKLKLERENLWRDSNLTPSHELKDLNFLHRCFARLFKSFL